MSDRISVVVPVYNEEECLEAFYARTTQALREAHLQGEILFVNDGSGDGSSAILDRLRDKDRRVKIIEFSRNFGHQIAIKAGIDHAEGDAVVLIDADLQDPPEAIPLLVAKWREGWDVVYAVRASRAGESAFKRWTAAIYYRIIRRLSGLDLPLDAGDFRLLSRPVADAVRQIREKNPYLRGLVSWLGFRQTGVPVHREERFAGETKYPLRKMMKLAWNGITHFSNFPMRLSAYLGFAVSIICLGWIAQALYVSLVLHVAVPGWTSIMVAVLFLGGVQLITMGVFGSYLWRSYDEARSRPLYIVRRAEGVER